MPRSPDAKAILNALGNVSAEGAALQVFGEAGCQALEAMAEPSPWDPSPDTLHCTQEELIAWAQEFCALGKMVREARVALNEKLSAWLVQRAADVKSGEWKHPPMGSGPILDRGGAT
jgi:hypothetical protein